MIPFNIFYSFLMGLMVWIKTITIIMEEELRREYYTYVLQVNITYSSIFVKACYIRYTYVFSFSFSFQEKKIQYHSTLSKNINNKFLITNLTKELLVLASQIRGQLLLYCFIGVVLYNSMFSVILLS